MLARASWPGPPEQLREPRATPSVPMLAALYRAEPFPRSTGGASRIDVGRLRRPLLLALEAAFEGAAEMRREAREGSSDALCQLLVEEDRLKRIVLRHGVSCIQMPCSPDEESAVLGS